MELEAYTAAISALGAMALLMFVQVIVVDVVGLRAKHSPGSAVEADHGNILFRVSRTVANTNESIAVFILALLFCVLSGASPAYTGYAAWAYVIARILFALCYYTNQQTLRSVCFGLSLFSLASLLVTGFLR